MIDFLYQTTDVNLFLILSSILLAMSVIALLLIRAFFPLHLRYQENEVIGCTSALVILIYGVIAGFATLYLINNNGLASDAIQREANAVANVYRDSLVINDQFSTQIKADLNAYLKEVLNDEWPLMQEGKTIPFDGGLIIRRMAKDIAHYNAKTAIEVNQISDMFLEVKNLYNARQNRIEISYVSLNVEIWYVILIGTVLALVVSYLFGVNFYLHLFIVTAAALMSACVMFLLISLDKPFQGEYVVGLDSLSVVQQYINR